MPVNILIIKPSSLGDIIHALPFLHAVKESFPASEIDWVISDNLRKILEDNPLINRLISFKKDEWKKITRLPETLTEISALKKSLRAANYDIVADLQGLLRTGLMTLSASSSQKIGFADAREGSRLFYSRTVKTGGAIHAVDKNLEAARAIGAEINKIVFPLHINVTAKENAKRLLAGAERYVVIVPSARWATKRWPPENFRALINKLEIPAVIAGSSGDKKIAKFITGQGVQAKEKRAVIDLCGRTDLQELAAVLAGAKAVVTNDSGPMHIAAALGVPVVALFGPTDPEKTGPYGWQNDDHLTVIRSGVHCRPCRRRKCDEFICMDDISVDKVFDELKKHL